MTDATLEHCPAGSSGHRFETVAVRLKGRGAMETCAIEQCGRCANLRINHDVGILGEVGDDG